MPSCVLSGRDSIHDKLILNKANVFNILANSPGLSWSGVINKILSVAFQHVFLALIKSKILLYYVDSLQCVHIMLQHRH